MASTATLVFKDYGWDVVTASWSAGAKNSSKVQICYLWESSLGDRSHNACSVELPMDIEQFLEMVQGGGVVDLRPYQA